MAISNFSSENNTYRKLIGNGLTYSVPAFQRDYSWTEEEWADLWSDIVETTRVDGEPAHYMGYLVLQTSNGKIFDVIDGQQRLTTLSLIVLSALKILQKLVVDKNNALQNQQRLEQLRNTYIGYLDPITLQTRSKISLNRNNNEYFQNYLIPLRALPVRGFKASEHALRKAFEWYEKQLRIYVKGTQGDEGVALATLIENMSDRLFFTVITVNDELNAFKVFETLNARGVRLSSTDLLKNYLFSVLHKEKQHDHEMTLLENRWESIVSRLGSESFTEFVRSHWNSRYSFVRTPDLFKTIRAKVTGREQVFALLLEMEEDIDHYLAMTNPDHPSLSHDHKKHLQQLKMFRVRQPYPLLLAAWRLLSDSQFNQLLRACVVIVFRYNVIANLPTNEQEHVYFGAIQKLTGTPKPQVQSCIQALSEIYPPDEAFKGYFSEKVIRTTDSRNNKIVRYILAELEYQHNQQSVDMNTPAVTIEHVLPQNPQEGWDQFSEEDLEALTYRIGNMAMLESTLNKQIDNQPYAAKCPVLASSQFGLTQDLANNSSTWTPEKISVRQRQLAKLATSIWRIDQLS